MIPREAINKDLKKTGLKGIMFKIDNYGEGHYSIGTLTYNVLCRSIAAAVSCSVHMCVYACLNVTLKVRLLEVRISVEAQISSRPFIEMPNFSIMCVVILWI